MTISPGLKAKYLERLGQLIDEGQGLVAALRPKAQVPGGPRDVFEEAVQDHRQRRSMGPELQKWYLNCITLLEKAIPPANFLRTVIEDMKRALPETESPAKFIPPLEAVYENLRLGFLDDLSLVVRSQVATDYLHQAGVWLRNGYHIPAAVAAGAVLDDCLRRLCQVHDLPVSFVEDGRRKRRSMEPMNQDLAAKGVYNATRARIITEWAVLHHDAVQGRLDRVKRSDVEQMVGGIRDFAADYLR